MLHGLCDRKQGAIAMKNISATSCIIHQWQCSSPVFCMEAYASQLCNIMQGGVIHKPPEWDTSDSKQYLMVVEDLMEQNSTIALGSYRCPDVQRRCLAAAATLREVMEHQGNVAANQVTLPALTPASVEHSPA